MFFFLAIFSIAGVSAADNAAGVAAEIAVLQTERQAHLERLEQIDTRLAELGVVTEAVPAVAPRDREFTIVNGDESGLIASALRVNRAAFVECLRLPQATPMAFPVYGEFNILGSGRLARHQLLMKGQPYDSPVYECFYNRLNVMAFPVAPFDRTIRFVIE